jgi:hypothetical protein
METQLMHSLARIGLISFLLIAPELPSLARAEEQSPPGKTAGLRNTAPASALFASAVRPFLAKHCTECHSGSKPKGGVNLAALEDEARALKSRKVWTKLKENVDGLLMPPEGRQQPSRQEVEAVSKWIDTTMTQPECGLAVDPGRVTIRRLNRTEYYNTIRDLMGVDFRPADDFPSDDVGFGFDNMGDVLTIPPILMEKYLAAAESIAEQSIMTGPTARGPIKTREAHALGAGAGGEEFKDSRILTSSGEITVTHRLPRDGAYVLRVRAYGQQAGREPVRMAVLIDGKRLQTFDVKAVEEAPGTYEVKVSLRGGSRRLGASFLNDYYKPDDPDPGQRDRNLVVEAIEVQGPLLAKGDPLLESQRGIIFRTPKTVGEFQDCASEVLQKFTMRAYRRPVTGGELARLIRFVDLARENGDSFARGIQLAVQAALVSPQFLFRVELRRGRRKTGGEKTSNDPISVPLNDFEVASRLSYFLWSSMPDQELFTLAGDGRLHTEENLTVQVGRMLRDPKAHALVENFAGQWLQLRNLKTVSPDKEQFPSFDEPLREAMQRESELFFASAMREDKSILDFLDSGYTFLNERLARHYGIPGVSGDSFQKVRLKGHERGGLITQASVLTVTSNPTRTSPVKRGKWVLEQILGTPPPAPPPNVPPLAEDKNAILSGTLRQRMEQHRSNPSCAVCHNRLDPPGFGLENYDAVGAWRDKDGSLPIDASGKLPGGESFRGPAELKAMLKTHKREFTRCLAQKLLTYALGRGLEDYDSCTIDRIVDAVAAGQYKFGRLVLEIVKSDPFLKRRG